MRQITVPMSAIQDAKLILRQVDKETDDYRGLFESIKNKGFNGAIVCRMVNLKDKEGNDILGEDGQPVVNYEVVEGRHRYNVCKDLGYTEINVIVKEMTDEQVLEYQIMANVHKIETKPVEYTTQLLKILRNNPTMVISELAATLGKSPKWLEDRLSIKNIVNEDIKVLVNEGKISLQNAYGLAKLPEAEQLAWVEKATHMPANQFMPEIGTRLNEIKAALKKGKEAAPVGFVAIPRLRSLVEVTSELESHISAEATIKAFNAKTSIEVWDAALKWASRLDPATVAEQKAKYEQAKKEREEAQKKRDEEKAKKLAEGQKVINDAGLKILLNK